MKGYKFKYKFSVAKPGPNFKLPENKISTEKILACHRIPEMPTKNNRYCKRYYNREQPYLSYSEVNDILDDMREDGASFSFDE